MTTAVRRLTLTLPPGFVAVPTASRADFDNWASTIPRRRSSLGQPAATLEADLARLAASVASAPDDGRQWLVAIPDAPYHQSVAVVAWITAAPAAGMTVDELRSAAGRELAADSVRTYGPELRVEDFDGRPALTARQTQAVAAGGDGDQPATLVVRYSGLLLDASKDVVVRAEVLTADIRLRDVAVSAFAALLNSARPEASEQ